MGTGIPQIDMVAKIIISIILLAVFIIFGKKLIEMLAKAQYGQLLALVVVYGFVFWVLWDPQGFNSFVGGIFNNAENKINTNSQVNFGGGDL